MYSAVIEDPYQDTGEADTIAFTGEVNDNFPDMRDWILEHVSSIATSRYVYMCMCMHKL